MSNPNEIVAQMKIRILELADKTGLILNEDDREFILGLHMLMEMEEPIAASYAHRVGKIYEEVLRNSV